MYGNDIMVIIISRITLFDYPRPGDRGRWTAEAEGTSGGSGYTGPVNQGGQQEDAGGQAEQDEGGTPDVGQW